MKYYAVKNGRKVGIFTTWEECKAQVNGYSDAKYKSFKTHKEALDFLKGDEKKEVTKKDTVIAYVDGSYCNEKKIYSYGCIIVLDDKTIEFGGTGKTYIEMRNVAGEIMGSIEAIKWAISNKYTSIIIHYDYEGIEKWANGIWKTNKEGTRKYAKSIQEYRNFIDVEFKKVKAHSGDFYNEQADKLAKSCITSYF